MRRQWMTSLQETPSLSIIPWSLGHSELYILKERKMNCYADALSSVSQMLPRKGEEDTDINMVNELTSVVPVPVNDLVEIRAEMTQDPVFVKILEYRMQGWPDSRSKVSKEVQPYWIHQMELAVEDVILLKMNRIIIPPHLRPCTLSKIHKRHLCFEKSYLKARDTVFWSGMKEGIIQLVECYEICLSNANSQK